MFKIDKYKYIFVLISSILAQNVSNNINIISSRDDDPFEFNQSTEQAFYFVYNINSDITGGRLQAYCNGELVGSREWSDGWIDIPAMGYDGDASTAGYMGTGEVPTFKLLDAEGKLTNLSVVGDI